MDILRLRRAIEIVADHPDYPGKQDLILASLADLDAWHREGRLSAEDRRILQAALLTPAEPNRPRERHLARVVR